MKKQNGTFIYIILIFAVIFLIYNYITEENDVPTLPIQTLATEINAGQIKSLSVEGDTINVVYNDGQITEARKEPISTTIEQLQAFGVEDAALQKIAFNVQEPTDWASVLNVGGTLLGIIAMGAIAYMFIRQFQGVNNQAMSFGKSRARMFAGDRPEITFNDVAGAREAKQDLKEIVEFLKEPEKFINLGARIPSGVLLVGAPGTGKTLMAKAVAGEAGVPFFNISGSEFVEMFVGVGASRVRDLFEQAKRHSPCIVFIDEVDAVGRHRGAGVGGSHDEREQTLNQILVEMDGFGTDTNIIVIAATNRPDILDPALLRPGRFDRHVVLDRPDIRGREAIFQVHVRGKPLSPNVDLEVLAQGTPGFVGADIENAINEAAILAARRGKQQIGMSEFQKAIERVITGTERRSRVISEEERQIFAYHEAGHALVAHVLPKCDPVRKVSIIATGMAGGYTLTLPEKDLYVTIRSKMEDDMAYGLAGRAAEELIFGEASTGASSDLERVTQTARKMVMRYGMSKKLGPVVYGKKEELVFLGREINEQRDYSESLAEEIDHEVRQIINRAYQVAQQVLQAHREELERIVKHLMERETLYTSEFIAAFEGHPLPDIQDVPSKHQPEQVAAAAVAATAEV
ncbi:MAG TPA: ATP-dependent metallopeptidase FtsH/Yme1/Tma family protein [Thermoflexia bacterium]|nr:ATP-dependent metallopeptidase FtsH/Yme1/Tma family protein [Thermoflexia bacterium]